MECPARKVEFKPKISYPTLYRRAALPLGSQTDTAMRMQIANYCELAVYLISVMPRGSLLGFLTLSASYLKGPYL